MHQRIEEIEHLPADIFFLSGEWARRFAGRAGVLVGFKGAKKRIPMGTDDLHSIVHLMRAYGVD